LARDIIDKFTVQYREHCSTGSGNGYGQLPLPIISLPPLPSPCNREDYPKVIWMLSELVDRALSTNRGETDGSMNTKVLKPKVGRPSKNNTEQSTHPYLQTADGSPVNRKVILCKKS